MLAVKMYVDGKLNGGVVFNQDGDFQLPVKDKLKTDSIVASCIGYRSLRVEAGQLRRRPDQRPEAQ